MPLLQVKNLKKKLGVGPASSLIVDVPEFQLAKAAQVGIRGRSGSGKTTFLHLLSGILAADEGSVSLDGQDLVTLKETERDRLRATKIGNIYQSFNLLPAFTALENVLLGMTFGPGADPLLAETLLSKVGLENRLHHKPGQLSFGQQQRVAIARALANKPQLVLADEPTGSLDEENARNALLLIQSLCQEIGCALLVVSHDSAILGQFETVLDFQNLNRASGLKGGI